jgi:HSP20 family protein
MTLVKFAKGNTNREFNATYNDVFESFFNADQLPSKSTVNRIPAVNIAENDNEFQIEIAAPGLSKEDFKINLEKYQLSVNGGRQNEIPGTAENKKYNRCEFNYSVFSRNFTLPETVDINKIQADYKDGILFIKIPKKAELKIQTREIIIG